jgi:hypothetical protein
MIDWIQGEKFPTIADFVYYPEGAKDCNPLLNTFCHCALKKHNIIYTHTLYVKQLFDEIRKLKCCTFTIITHNCDENINDASILPDNVVMWFAQNVNIDHPRIQSIPIGLENDKWFKGIRKKEKMEAKLRTPKRYKNLVYLNSNTVTNPKEREPLYTLFEKQNWVTAVRGVNGRGFDEYLDNMYNHKFVFCPDGNGIDTHRLWETLYLNSVPIVKRGINIKIYYKIPMIVVTDWKQLLGKQKQLEEYLDLEFQNWEKDMLTFEYWKEKIRNYVSN